MRPTTTRFFQVEGILWNEETGHDDGLLRVNFRRDREMNIVDFVMTLLPDRMDGVKQFRYQRRVVDGVVEHQYAFLECTCLARDSLHQAGLLLRDLQYNIPPDMLRVYRGCIGRAAREVGLLLDPSTLPFSEASIRTRD